jgi:hypothetical protein
MNGATERQQCWQLYFSARAIVKILRSLGEIVIPDSGHFPAAIVEAEMLKPSAVRQE